MITKTIEITEISVNELTDIIAEKLFNKLKMYLADYKSSEEDVFLSPKETAEFLKISRGTLWRWTKNKKINCYGMGGRRYYNIKELVELLSDNILSH